MIISVILLCFACSSPVSDRDTAGTIRMVVGSYSGESGDDISIIDLDTMSGKLSKTGGLRVGDNPSFITQGRSNGLLYAINETDNYKGSGYGGLTTLKINPSGSDPEIRGGFELSGTGPCYISSDRTGNYLFVSGYGDGSLSVIANNDKGIPELETTFLRFSNSGIGDSHPHMVYQPQSSNFLYISDLGHDRILVYHTFYSDKNIFLWKVSDIPLEKYSGPRHFLTDSTGSMIYVLNEFSSDVTFFKRYRMGDYVQIEKFSTLPAGFKGENFAAEIAFSNDGRFIYTSNRGHNSITVFRRLADYSLEYVESINCAGDWPRNFAISPDGSYMVVANERSGTLTLFNINKETGILHYSGESLEINSPSCVIFVSE